MTTHFERDLSSPYYFQYLALQLVERRSSKKRDVQSRRRKIITQMNNTLNQVDGPSSDHAENAGSQTQFSVSKTGSNRYPKDSVLSKASSPKNHMQIYDELLSENSIDDELVHEYPLVPSSSPKTYQNHQYFNHHSQIQQCSSPIRSSPTTIPLPSPTFSSSSSGNSSPSYKMYGAPMVPQETPVPFYCISPKNNAQTIYNSSPSTSPKHIFSPQLNFKNNQNDILNSYNDILYNTKNN